MAGTAANARVWLDADVYTAPLGTTAPTDVTTAWAAAWLPLGLLSVDGLTEGHEENITDHQSWGKGLVRRTRSGQMASFGVTALEDNPVVWALKNPGSTATTLTGTTTRIVKPKTANIRAFGIETIDGGITRRLIVARGEAFVEGDIASNEESMQMVALSIAAYTSGGSFYTEITNDPQAVVV